MAPVFSEAIAHTEVTFPNWHKYEGRLVGKLLGFGGTVEGVPVSSLGAIDDPIREDTY